MAAAVQTPWEEPLYPIFERLSERGKQLVEQALELPSNADIIANDPHFKPLEGLSDLLGAKSIDELSLLAFAYSHTLEDWQGMKDDAMLCEFLGKDLYQCNEEDVDENAFTLTINGKPFFKEPADYLFESCKKLFMMIQSTMSVELTSSQFLYILLGMQQKNSSKLLSAFKEDAIDLILKKNKSSDKDTIKRIKLLLNDYIITDLSNIKINIVLEEAEEEGMAALIYFSLSIPIRMGTDEGLLLLQNIVNFNFFVDVSERHPAVLYYEVPVNSVRYITDVLEFYYIFLVKNMKRIYRVLAGDNKLTPIIDRNLVDQLKREIETATAEANMSQEGRAAKEEQKIASKKAREARAAASNVEARLATRFLGGGGKRFKRKSKRHSMWRYSHKNKSRKSRKNKKNKNK